MNGFPTAPFNLNPIFQTDSYKVSHAGFTAEGTEVIYSNLTARSFKIFQRQFPNTDHKSVFFGLQAFIVDVLINQWNQFFFGRPKAEVIAEIDRLFNGYLGGVKSTHFAELHDLGYLPVEIKALPEGSLVPVKVPYFTIQNTDDRFQWITNYLETIISSELWKVITVATVGREFRKLSNTFAMQTTGSTAGTEFQNHDFSFRGQANWHSAASLGAAFLLSSNGTDNIPAIPWLEHYYGANIDAEFIAASVPATEHSVSCLGTAVYTELEFIRRSITEAYPTGIVSIVSDTYDYWKVITEFLPILKEDILGRQENALGLAKVVIRPDSGDPVKIICGYHVGSKEFADVDEAYNFYDGNLYNLPEVIKVGNTYRTIDAIDPGRVGLGKELTEAEVKGSIQCLWDVFGGTINEQGYKVLNPRIGLIYGDSITYERAKEIYTQLAEKGFASINVVFGVGSYALSVHSRDTLGMAIKATAAKVNGKWIELFKDPKTDNGTKKSAKGLMTVWEDKLEGAGMYMLDQQTPEQEQTGALKTVFRNGQLVGGIQTFSEIKARIWS